MTGYVELDQARWDLQVATGQTVAGSGVEARMREARAAAGRLAAGLPGLLDELEQLRRPQLRPLPVELADARAEIERLTTSRDRFVNRLRNIRAELPGVPLTGLATAVAELRTEVEREKLRRINVSNTLWAHIAELHEDHQAAERALEAVRAVIRDIDSECPDADQARSQWWEAMDAVRTELRAALSAASPTTSDERPTFRQLLRSPTEQFDLHSEMLAPLMRSIEEYRDAPPCAATVPTASDEPARTPDLMAALRASFGAAREAAKQRRLGPAASGTPDDCWPGSDR